MPHKHYVTIKAAVAKNGKLLMQREATNAGDTVYAMPGGRIEAGEDIIAGLRREVKEELGVELATISPQPIKIYTAATKAGQGIVALVYRATLASEDFRYDLSETREVDSAGFVDKETVRNSPPFVHTEHILKYFDEFVAQ